MDQLADELGMDPLELRRKNFIPPDNVPARDGDRRRLRLRQLRGCARQAARARRRRRASAPSRSELRAEGVYRGIGFSTYTEICGLAPSRVVGPSGFGLQGGGWESAHGPRPPERQRDGLHRHLAARPGPRDRLRADRRRPARRSTRQQVEVIHGDTATGPEGLGTYGSRSLAVGGEAVARAAEKVADEGEGDRRAPARGGAGGHRGPRRQVPGQGLAGQGA